MMRDPNNPSEMLQLAREGLTAWRAARERTAAERRAARTIAYAFGRIDELAQGRADTRRMAGQPMTAPTAAPPARRNQRLATPRPADRCYVCERKRAEIPGELVRLFGRWVCRDRVDCYRKWRP